MNAPAPAAVITPSLRDLIPNGAGFTDVVSNDAYHADRSCVSVSGLKEILRSPAHFQCYLDGTSRIETPAMIFGTAAHRRILEPQVFADRYVIAPVGDRRVAAYKEFVEANPGKIVLTPDQKETLDRMADSVAGHQTATTLISGGWKEVTLIWQDKETGIWLKIRPDCLCTSFASGICLDLKKTANDASPAAFVRMCVNYDYDLQAAVYLEGLREVLQRDFDFVFLPVEQTAPYGVALYGASAEMLERGQRRFRTALNRLKECRDSGAWPSYQPAGDYEILDWPRWAY